MFKIEQDSRYSCPKCSKQEEIEKQTVNNSYLINILSQFDLIRGDSSTFREMPRNEISTGKYTVWSFLPLTLFENFMRGGNLFFLAVSLIMLIDRSLSPFYNWIVVFPVGFYAFIFMMKELIFELFKRRNDGSINNQVTKRGKRNEGILEENVRWGDILVGDILYLEKGDIVPADLILLDSGQVRERSAICFIDTFSVDGKVQLTKKNASYLTQILVTRVRQKKNYVEYRKKLTGKIEYEVPQAQMGVFNGSLKLKKDPKIEQLTWDNFIPRGSVIKQTTWMYGLVVYAGNETKVQLNSNHRVHKKSYIENLSQWLFLFIMFIVMIFAVISVIVLVARSKDLKFLLQYDTRATDGVRFFSYVILFSQMIPLSMYFFIDLITLIYKFQDLERPLNSYYNVNRSDTMTDLAQVKYMLLDKTGTLTQGQFKIDMVQFGEQTFYLDHNLLTKQLSETQKYSKIFSQNAIPFQEQKQALENQPNEPINQQIQLVSEDNDVASEENVDFKKQDHRLNEYNITNRHIHNTQRAMVKLISPVVQIQQQLIEVPAIDEQVGRRINFSIINKQVEGQIAVNNNEFLQNLRDCSNDLLMDSFLKTISICHESKLAYYLADDVSYESPSKEEEVVLDFAKSCGYRLERIIPNEQNYTDYVLRLPYQSTYVMKVLGINNFTYSRRVNSVVVDNDLQAHDTLFHTHEKEGGILVCKGDPESMKSLLVMDEQQRLAYEKSLEHFRERGVKVYAYASRELTAEQKHDYCKQYQSFRSSLMTQDSGLEQLAKEMETKLSLIGFISFKDELKPDAKNLIKLCKDTNITPWILSGDNRMNTYNTALQCGMIAFTDKPLVVKAKDKIEIGSELKVHLSTIKMEIQDRTNQKNINELEASKGKDQMSRSKSFRTVQSIVKHDIYEHVSKQYVLIDGSTLDIIMSDSYLYQHFCFIVCVIQKVIGYNLQPRNKQQLCEIIQNKFPKAPTVLAIGDGYNDSLMLQQATIGIEIVSQIKDGAGNQRYQALGNAGDFQISELSELKELILVKGTNNFFKAQNVLHFLFYKSVLLGLPLFYFNWYCSFTGTTLHDSMFIFLYNFLFNILNISVIGVLDVPCLPQVLLRFPVFHIDGQRLKKIQVVPFLMRSLVEAFFQATIIFYFSLYVVQSSVNLEGQRGDINMLSLLIIYSIIIVFNFKTFFMCMFRVNGVKTVWLTTIIGFGFVIGFVLANTPGKFSRWNFAISTKEVFTRFDTVMCLVYNIVCSLLVGYLINVVIRPRWYPTLYEQYAVKNYEGQDWQFWDNSKIMNRHVKPHLNISKIVRKVFQHTDALDTSVQEMINPADMRVIEMKINRITLSITNNTLQRKFNYHQLQVSVVAFRITYVFILLLYGAYSLTTTLTVNQTDDQQVISFVRLGIFIFFLLLIVITYIDYFVSNYYAIAIHFVGLAIIVKAIYDWSFNDINISLSAVLVCSLSTLTHVNLEFIYTIGYIILYVAQFIIRIIFLYFGLNISTSEESLAKSLGIPRDDEMLIKFYACTTVIVLIFFISVILMYTFYMGVKQKRFDYLAKEQIELEQQLNDDILSILVPKFVKTQMAQGRYTMEEAQDDVAILFLYICEFDSIMNIEGKNVVPMLDNLFRLYDNLCIQHGVQKIETVGYTYMAAAGIQACEVGISQHILSIEKTNRLVNLAFDMKKQVAGKVYGPKNTQVEIKVGIHIGRVIAGVIGHHKPQFSLIGDPVNYTSRVCSTGMPGAVTLSDTAFMKARSFIKYSKKVQAEMKGLGMVDNYQVFSERPQSMPETNFQMKVKNLLLKQQTKLQQGEDKKSFDQKSIIGNALGAQGQGQVTTVDDDQDDEVYEHLEEKSLLQPNRYLLTIPNQQLEEYLNSRKLLKETRHRAELYMLGFFWCTYIFMTLILIAVKRFFRDSVALFLVRILFLLILLPFPMISRAYQSSIVQIFYVLIFSYGTVTPSVTGYLSDIEGIKVVALVELIMILIAAGNLSVFNFVQVIFITTVGMVTFFVLYGISGSLNNEYIYFIVISVFFIYANKYISLRQWYKSYNNLQHNQSKKIQMEEFVSQLLPTHAFNKLKQFSLNDKMDLTDEFEEVTILFADIKGFTNYSNSVVPEQVVNMLRSLFTEFDKMCQKFNVYKVYTIGDCYVVLGFLNSANRKPELEAINVVKMGLSMVEIIRDVRKRINFMGLDMRIGIHTGKVIGGIIGTSIVRYDIYGQDVSIANKMESNGVEGNIMVSETTKMMLGNQLFKYIVQERNQVLPFAFKFKEKVKIEKFKTEINAYLIRMKGEELFESEQKIEPQHNAVNH